jgi:hypothetical protein
MPPNRGGYPLETFSPVDAVCTSSNRAASLDAYLVSVMLRLSSASSPEELARSAKAIVEEIADFKGNGLVKFDADRGFDGVFVCGGCDAPSTRALIPVRMVMPLPSA